MQLSQFINSLRFAMGDVRFNSLQFEGIDTKKLGSPVTGRRRSMLRLHKDVQRFLPIISLCDESFDVITMSHDICDFPT